jgi:hypothetical protein
MQDASRMTSEEALTLIESWLEGQPLKAIQKQVFQCCWQGMTYPEIAKHTAYDVSYIRDVGAELWQQLSQVCGEQVTKKTLHSVMRRQRLQRQSVEGRSSLHTPASIDNQPAQRSQAITAAKIPSSYDALPSNRWHWREAIDVSVFYGRDQELTQLTQWIVADSCRVVAVLGIGGIGKTTLAAKLEQTLVGNRKGELGHRELEQPSSPSTFTHFVWQSLRNAPSLQEVLATPFFPISKKPSCQPLLKLSYPD